MPELHDLVVFYCDKLKTPTQPCLLVGFCPSNNNHLEDLIFHLALSLSPQTTHGPSPGTIFHLSGHVIVASSPCPWGPHGTLSFGRIGRFELQKSPLVTWIDLVTVVIFDDPLRRATSVKITWIKGVFLRSTLFVLRIMKWFWVKKHCRLRNSFWVIFGNRWWVKWGSLLIPATQVTIGLEAKGLKLSIKPPATGTRHFP